ncbi:hypothetical protein SAMN02949497_1927 [Methylomagnum ishizawai]|uniref:Uncharacterized protein n=1 Tax=Methylomagnum ishizawai TaxID=1760988 RepID=A0A1Y6CWH4_9GAMM|nr:hypothetical protein [Methylomagnum ishizawai]SMF94606.1 hypothetical protein SAMN02949497_1927 [Methylomagnum ishizawai]
MVLVRALSGGARVETGNGHRYYFSGRADGTFCADVGVADVAYFAGRAAEFEVVDSVATGLASATLANVASSATSVVLVVANARRNRLIVVNDSASILYLKFGVGASSTSFSIRLYPNETYESPPSGVYTGRVDAIWSAVNGAARVTEL